MADMSSLSKLDSPSQGCRDVEFWVLIAELLSETKRQLKVIISQAVLFSDLWEIFQDSML